jgi:hypothetical protein
LGSQEVGKLSLPSFSFCWPKALPFSAAVIPATSIRHFGFMGASGRVRSLTTATVGCSKHQFRECDACQWHRALPLKVRNSAPSAGSSRECYTGHSQVAGLVPALPMSLQVVVVAISVMVVAISVVPSNYDTAGRMQTIVLSHEA